MVSVNNFSVQFSGISILEDINFDVQKGEIVTLLGQSGCGKTTILRAIAGLQREHDGEICIGDTCVSSKEVFEKNRKVGYIFQDYALFPHLNVSENIAFALDHLRKKDKEKRVDELLKQFDILNHKNKEIHQLSGGQQQRVAIARAMANNPEILLLDEPFANLDSQLRYKTKMWLKKLIKKHNLSAILVTHDRKEALTISDKIGIIYNKQLLQFDTNINIYNKPKNLYIAQFLSEVNIIPEEVLNKFNLKKQSDEIALIDIENTFITNEKKEDFINLELIDSSFCGEYFELLMRFKDIKSNDLIIRQKFFENYDNYYLDINKENIKIIKQ